VLTATENARLKANFSGQQSNAGTFTFAL